MADEQNEATEFADTLHRHGAPDPSKWDEAEAVTDRPNDTPLRGEDKPAVPNTTLSERAKARSKEVKAADVEDKAVTSASTKKAPAKKAAAKK